MEQKKKVFLTFVLLIAILAGFWFIGKAITAFTGYSITEIKNLEQFTKCLANKTELYVNAGCSHCANQKSLFGDSLKYLKITDCAVDTDKCIEAGVTQVPTWIINNEKAVGVQSLKKLSELSECELKS